MTLVCVTLNDGDDWNDHIALLDYGFSEYRLERAAAGGQILASTRVRSGTAASVPLMAAEDLCYPLTGEERLTVVARTPVSVPAPVVPGQAIGEVCAYLNGEEVASVELVAAAPSAKRAVEESGGSGWWERLFGASGS